MKISADQREKIIDALVTYSADRFQDMTWEKGRIVKTIYSVILQATIDLYHGNKDEKKDAQEYFDGVVYLEHCQAVAIDEDLMDQIVLGVKNWLKNIGSYDTEDENF